MKRDIPDAVLKDITMFAERNSVNKVILLVLVLEEQILKEVILILLFTAEILIRFIGTSMITLIHYYLLILLMPIKTFQKN